MLIGFVKERQEFEYRVALCPFEIKKLISLGHKFIGQKGAGVRAGFSDEMYIKEGAKLKENANEVYEKADLVVQISAPDDEENLRKGLMIAADFESYKYPERTDVWCKKGIKALALERLPRISRLQDVDVLSSQNNLAGYKAALTAMNMLNLSVPLMMTSAGTLLPVKAFVMGLGVAGLQAVATLQRMGAMVFATDVRAETAEQAVSLGARFVENTVENIKNTLQQSHILITAAQTLAKNAPLLVDEKMLQNMPENSVAIDMSGGNIKGTQNGKVLKIGKVKVVSSTHFAADVAYSASFLYSKNMFNLISRLSELQNDNEVWQKILLSGE